MTDKSYVENAKQNNTNGQGKIVVGLDIGTTKIACFVGKKNEHGKIEILTMGKSISLGVSRGSVTNIDKTIESILEAVQVAQSRVEGNLIIKNVNVGIAGQHIKSLQHRGIYTKKEFGQISQTDIDALIDDMYRLVMNPGEAIIKAIPQEYIVDNEKGIKDPIGMAGVRLEANFHIITGHVSNVTNINTCVERCGLSVKSVILEPIASAHAVLSEEEKEAGVVLVDIGGGTTDIAIFHDGIIRHTAVIPFGGNAITEDIRNGCKIIPRHAETLKVEYGSAFASESKDHEFVCIAGLKGRESREIGIKTLASIIQARMEEIIELVQREIVYSGFAHKIIGGIVVTGGGSQLNHIIQLFEYKTGMDTRIGFPTEHLANNNKIENLASPIFSTGIGLVLKGFEDLEKGVDPDPITDTGDVRGSTTRNRGSFFSSVFSKKAIDKLSDFFTKDEE